MKEKYTLRNKTGRNGLGAGVWNIGPGSDPFGGPAGEFIPILDRLPILAGPGSRISKHTIRKYLCTR